MLLVALLLGRLVAWAPGPPDWVAPAPGAFPDVMAVTGVVQIDGAELRSSQDLVAAFVDGEVRGVTGPTLVGSRRVFLLTVAGGPADDALAFKAYDATADRVVDLQPEIAFAPLEPAGTTADPVVWTPFVGGGPPAWNPDPADFDGSMLVTARVVRGGAVVEDARVAAFVDGAVRGSGDVGVFGGLGALAFLSVLGDAGETADVAFRVYLPGPDRTFRTEGTVALAVGGSAGTAREPVELTVGGGPELTGAEGWRMLAPAGADATVPLVLGDLWTQGFPGAGAPGGTANVYRYDEPTGTYLAPDSADDPWPRGTGRFVYVFDDDTPGAPGGDGFPKPLPSVGIGPSGPFAFALSRTPANGEPDGPGWNLLGNPFDQAVDWDAGWTRADVAGSVYVWDPGYLGGGYRSWNGSVGALAGGVVPAGNAFWAEATGPAPVLVAPVSARVGAADPVGRTDPPTQIALRLTSETRPGLGAEAFVAVLPGALGPEAEADPLDAWVLASFADATVTLGSARPDGRLLAIDARPPLDGGRMDVPLAVSVSGWPEPATEALALTWPVVDVPEGWALTLVDAETGARVDLRAEGAYRFTVTTDGAPTGRRAMRPRSPARLGVESPPRFRLEVEPDGATAVAADRPLVPALSAPWPNPSRGPATLTYRLGAPADVRLAVFDALGRRVLDLPDGPRPAGEHAARLDLSALPAGTYRVRLEADGRAVSRAVTVVR